MNKQNFPVFHRQKVWSRQLLAFVQRLMRSKASTAVFPLASPSWLQDGSCYSRHHAQSRQEERGRPEPAAAVPLYQKSKSFHHHHPQPPPLAPHPHTPFQLNSTQILLARLDPTVTPTCKGSWESELVQAGKGVRVGSERRQSYSFWESSLESYINFPYPAFIFI